MRSVLYDQHPAGTRLLTGGSLWGFLPWKVGPPLTPCAGERGNLLVSDSCLISHAGDRGSGHQASHPKDKVHRSVPLRADHQAPGTEDLERSPLSHAPKPSSQGLACRPSEGQGWPEKPGPAFPSMPGHSPCEMFIPRGPGGNGQC